MFLTVIPRYLDFFDNLKYTLFNFYVHCLVEMVMSSACAVICLSLVPSVLVLSMFRNVHSRAKLNRLADNARPYLKPLFITKPCVSFTTILVVFIATLLALLSAYLVLSNQTLFGNPQI